LATEEKSRTVTGNSAALARGSSTSLGGRRTVGRETESTTEDCWGPGSFGRRTVGSETASNTEDCGDSTAPDSARGDPRPGKDAGGSRTVAGCEEVLSASNGSRVVQSVISGKSATGRSSATGARGTADVFRSIKVSCEEAIRTRAKITHLRSQQRVVYICGLKMRPKTLRALTNAVVLEKFGTNSIKLSIFPARHSLFYLSQS
jgi:hypothetical protein